MSVIAHNNCDNLIDNASELQFMKFSYIPADRKDILKNFKYTGGTDSITYEYLWSPFAQFLLQFIPTWVAPNLITLSAMSMLAVVNVIFMLPDPNDELPDWKLVMMAVSILIYQHLDNIDGKQARKTNSSTPLGMLFDHGADAISAFLLGVQVMKILKLPFSFQLLTIYIFIMNTYFCAMWSQYSVGYFKLGRVNPVDEGLPAYAIMCLLATQINFSKYMNQKHVLGTYGEEVIYGLLLLLIPQTIYMTKDILKNRIIPKSQVLFQPLLFFSAGVAILLVWCTLPELSPWTFYSFFYAIMFMWSRNMINIQLQYITRQKYNVFNRGTLSFLILCAVYVLASRVLPISPEWYFLAVCIVQAIVFFEFVIRVLNEGAEILGIWLFSLKPRQTKIQ